MVALSDVIQICILLVMLIGLIVQIVRDRKK